MKKTALLVLSAMIIIATTSVAHSKTTTELAEYIKMYKSQNYTECYDKLSVYTMKEQSDALAYYYLAMAAAQLGKQDEAIDNYSRAISLAPSNSNLAAYARKGKRCLEAPEACEEAVYDTPLEEFIKKSKNVKISDEALVAAVEAGADAVYVGGSAFGARAYAKNFNNEELLRAVRYCHLNRVKLYVTVNTLVNDLEMASLSDYAAYLYEIGVDAVIAADLGVIREIRRRVPKLAVHASTQCSVHNVEGSSVVASFGCDRVVPARELSPCLQFIFNILCFICLRVSLPPQYSALRDGCFRRVSRCPSLRIRDILPPKPFCRLQG